MDSVLKQLETQEKLDKTNKNKFQFFYKIYHFIAKTILYSILMILVFISIIFVLYFVDMQINLKKGIRKPPLFEAYIIISPSMVPAINVYDAIVVRRAEPEELEIGDVITFLSSDPRYSGLTITHRIVGIEKSDTGDLYFRTKGDNNNTEDSSLVKDANINGKVILRIPKIGYIQHILTNAIGWIILIIIPCLGVVIYDIIKIFKSIRNNRLPKKEKMTGKQEINKEIEIFDTKIERDNDSEEIEIL